MERRFPLSAIVNPVQYVNGEERPKFRSYYIARKYATPDEYVRRAKTYSYWYIFTKEEIKNMIDQGIRTLE